MMNNRREPREDPEKDELADKKAVALKYDMEKNLAPKVVAKGKGHVAENILDAARKGKVPVYQNKSLVNMLMALELDKEIPAELYTTVAEILAYVYRIDQRRKNVNNEFSSM
ncbi:MAG: EscU/YscU/HrcU family type III secretion system export apparatus switch protein [Anaerovibrio sp.]|uniref:EscU/YscU/HrcU family type III secretion system export apparatus switch protein n=1 Tax=Anaerovibrio sp. TaxID=1872532 RepID=UPI0025ECB6B3|nr:EscU/YscU/HrcU family type III secretion system export apparatus switch protein [Anaerovibrio sp.]MCR5176466.1 EscU/YscU/HrcU family type III secretion system export apparatus switch protein [Anaerovibrio sp.]